MVSAHALARGVTSSATGDAQLRCRQIKITTGAVGQPAIRERNRGTRRALPSPGRSQLRGGEADLGVELRQQIVELSERGDHRQAASQLTADRKTLEVPGHVLAEV